MAKIPPGCSSSAAVCLIARSPASEGNPRHSGPYDKAAASCSRYNRGVVDAQSGWLHDCITRARDSARALGTSSNQNERGRTSRCRRVVRGMGLLLPQKPYFREDLPRSMDSDTKDKENPGAVRRSIPLEPDDLLSVVANMKNPYAWIALQGQADEWESISQRRRSTGDSDTITGAIVDLNGNGDIIPYAFDPDTNTIVKF